MLDFLSERFLQIETLEYYEDALKKGVNKGTPISTKLWLWESLHTILHRDHVYIPVYHRKSNLYSLIDCVQVKSWYRYYDSIRATPEDKADNSSRIHEARFMVITTYIPANAFPFIPLADSILYL